MDPRRQAIVDAAMDELGNESAARYWLDVLSPPQAYPRDKAGRPLSWCGACALWCLHKAGAAADVKWTPGLGYVGPCKLPRTSSPQPGDTAYRNRGQHYATVVEAGDGWVSTVDGNSSEKIDGVTRYGRVVLHERTAVLQWDAFFDVESLLPKAKVLR